MWKEYLRLYIAETVFMCVFLDYEYQMDVFKLAVFMSLFSLRH